MLAYLFPNARESICKLDDMLVLGTFSDFTEAGMVTVRFRPLASPPVAWMWPSGVRQIQTSAHAGGMASALMRLRTAASDSLEPSALMYVKPFPDFLLDMLGRASETYLNPADSAASFGSTIVRTSAAESNNAFLCSPGINLLKRREFQLSNKVG